MIARRSFLAGAMLAPCLPWQDLLAAQDERAPTALPALGPPQPFDFERLRQQAQQRASQPYQPPALRPPELLERIDYDVHEAIHYRPEAALWAQGDGPWPVQFFHLARLFREPVKMHVVRAGMAREIVYSPRLFSYGPNAQFAAALPDDLGFAGFRLMDRDPRQQDWLCFLGASYFRSNGELGQYGLSARGVAIDTGLPDAEEFPRFTQFWLEAGAEPDSLLIYALLDGPRLSGAYRVTVGRSQAVVMTIEAALFTRAAIQRLGIAPLTSMYWFGEADNHLQVWDWRPEVHDSDGLALWTGNGERIWRPLVDPPSLQTQTFADRDPKGFGLCQRDRSFDHYQDPQIAYQRRPSLWVEPLEPWGAGAVQLVEIPTRSEFLDNIVAYWVPQEPVAAGAALHFQYRLHWVADEPYLPALGRVVAVRLGWEDPLEARPNAPRQGALVVDFGGGPLESLSQDAAVRLMASIKPGRLLGSRVVSVTETRQWRAMCYLELAGPEPGELQVRLQLGDHPLTETCVYPCWLPAAPA